MTHIDTDKIETLLHMPEGQTLDFKEAQYRVLGATNEQKSEFVKDILAFANAWKDADAYILIGVRDNHAPPATVLGGVTHIDDAILQQLVNAKTNRAVHFEYVPLEHDGKAIAAIRIRNEQDRPLFLKRAFGRLKPNVVYVRRGSSTAEADPDEVAKMGRVASIPSPVLTLGIRELEQRGAAGGSLELVSKVLEERPPPSPEDQAIAKSLRALTSSLQPLRAQERRMSRFLLSTGLDYNYNKPSSQEIRRFLREEALLRAVVVEVDNPGQVLAADVSVELAFPVMDGLEVRHDPPEQPHGLIELAVSRDFRPSDTLVKRFDDEWEVTLRVGKIQPGTIATSDPFWIGCSSPLRLELSASIFGDNFSPVDSELSISLKVERGWLEDAEEEYGAEKASSLDDAT